MKILTILVSLFLATSSIAEDLSQIKFELMLAKRGDLSAQLRVASAYEHGNDVKKNLKEALRWYIEAANQSHAPSQYKVGYFYENGFGIAKNADTAKSWYKKAKANGSDQASQRLDKTAYEKGKKAAKTQRIGLQAKLIKEEKARAAKDKADAKKAKAKHEAKDKALAKQRALAKKQAQKAAAKKATQKVVAKKTPKIIKPKIVVAKKKPKAIKIPKMMKHVLKYKWKNQHGTADYLPSATTSCLESGDNELTCFSSEKSRRIKGVNVTFTTKSTLFGFKSNGSFKVIYNYNGINISGKKSKASDVYGLRTKEGWQEPAIAIKCLALDLKNLTCIRGSTHVKFKR